MYLYFKCLNICVKIFTFTEIKNLKPTTITYALF